MTAVGGMLVTAAAVMYTAAYSKTLREQAAAYSECAGMLERLASELCTERNTLSGAVTALSQTCRGRCRQVLDRLSAGMDSLGEQSLSKIWEMAWGCCRDILAQDSLAEIKRLGQTLGGFDAEGQREALMRTAAGLRAEGERLTADRAGLVRLRGGLAVSAAAVTVILLV